MRKSFKKVLAAVLAVLMVVCSFPMTALAAPGDYEPNVDLQFSTFYAMSASDPWYGQVSSSGADFSMSGLYDVPLVYDKNAGTLTLDAEMTQAAADILGVAGLTEDVVYQVGDQFAITVVCENISDLRVLQLSIAYSDNIEPAGYYSYKSGRNTLWAQGTVSEAAAASGTFSVGGTSPWVEQSSNALYGGEINSAADMSRVNTTKGTIEVACTGRNPSTDVSSLYDDYFANPETGDLSSGYEYQNVFVAETFIFEITGDGPISFAIADPNNTNGLHDVSGTYVALATDGAVADTYTTYAPEYLEDGVTLAPGACKMTFMGKNEFVDTSCAHANVTTSEEITAAATCEAAGSKTVTTTCADCGEVVGTETVVIPATGHSYSATETAPTCTTAGVITYTCSACDDTYTEAGAAATGHNMVETTPAVAPTCTTPGATAILTCANDCGTVTGGEEVAALGHTAGSPVTEKEVANSCTAAGSYDTVVYCTVCGAEISRVTTTVPATGHTEVEIPAVPATCTTPGATAGVECSVCDAVITAPQEVPATGHNMVETTPAVAPTCTTPGATAILTCANDCGTVTGGEEVAALGHTEVEIPAVPATCTTPGATAGVECSVCGDVITAPQEVPALGHTAGDAVVENNIAATCEDAGSYDTVVYCTVCDEEISRETTEVPATGHSYTSVVTPATCTTEGYTTYTCSVCGDTYKDAYVEALGHEFSVFVSSTAGDCLTVGTTTYKCSRCDATDVVEGGKGDHTPAAAVVEKEIAATCEAAGSYDTVVYCELCGEELSRETTEVPATGHNMVETTPAVAPTCTTPGATAILTCANNCGTVTGGEEVAALGHTEVTVPGYAATVDATGLTDGIQCSVCGEWIVAQDVIPMLDSVIVTVVEPDLGDVAGLAYGDNKLAVGTDYTLTATALDGATFIGWAINGKIVSESATYKSSAVNDVTIEAMFAEEGADTITVTFLDMWGNVVAEYANVTVADFQAAMAAGVPTAANVVGYNFSGWSMSDDAIKALDASAQIWAQYEVAEGGYTVTTDGELTLPEGVENGAIPYDTSVTVYAEGATGWKIGDVIVAYGDTYTFYVGADVTVVPVFDAVTAAPSVTMVKVTQSTADDRYVEFLATRSVPAGYKLVNAGFVYGKAIADADLVLENVGVNGVKVGYCAVNGADQFALNFGIANKDAAATAKAFVVYKDAAGTVTTIYSDYAEFVY